MRKIEQKAQGWLSLILGGGGSVFLAGLLYLSYRLAELDYPAASLPQVLASVGLIAVSAVLLVSLIFGIKTYLSHPRIKLWAFLGMSFSGISILVLFGLIFLSFLYE